MQHKKSDTKISSESKTFTKDIPASSRSPKSSSATLTTLSGPTMTRPNLQLNQSSFNLALSRVLPTDHLNVNLPTISCGNGPLDTPTKNIIKQDINLVQYVQSESLPLSILQIATPLLTPLPIPDTKVAFVIAVQTEAKKIVPIKTGLTRYLDTIHSGEHTVFSPAFLSNQTSSTNAALEELNGIKTQLECLVDEVGHIKTPIPLNDNHDADSTEEQDYFGISWNANEGSFANGTDAVRGELKQKFAELRRLVARIRGVVVASHVFYKINYALAVDKSMEAKKVEEPVGQQVSEVE